jgi:hypothetical protein
MSMSSDSSSIVSSNSPATSLRDRYPALIAGVYDSVDRVVFNGYLYLAATAGGMRTL